MLNYYLFLDGQGTVRKDNFAYFSSNVFVLTPH